MKKLKSKAFSLIEISVVIIVIGILIAGVTQGSALINKAKYNTAITLTQSSPVPSTPGLRLWLETSLEQSISKVQASDGTAVTVWYDLNPQISNKLFARTTSTAILYKVKSEINGLPSLYFPGAIADFFTISTSSGSTIATPIPTTNNAFSYFIVLKADSVGSVDDAFFNGTTDISGWGYRHNVSAKVLLYKGATATDTAVLGSSALAKAEVISATSDGGTLGALRLYVNGVSDGTFGVNVTATVTSPTVGFYIGSRNLTGSADNNWRGFISEIIIFEKKLSDADRKAIEKYLGTKYNIPVTI